MIKDTFEIAAFSLYSLKPWGRFGLDIHKQKA